MIPRLVHQIWLGSSPRHPLMVEWNRLWKKLNPDWAVLDWREAAPGRLEVSNTWASQSLPFKLVVSVEYRGLLERAANLAQRANIWRYFVLLHFGGLYVDCDIEPLRPVDFLLQHDAFTVARRQPTLMYENAFMGCRAGHPWMSSLVGRLPSRDPTVSMSMGCEYLTWVTRNFHPEVVLVSQDDVVFDPPADWEGSKKRGRLPVPGEGLSLYPGASLVHHWASLWYPRGFADLKAARTGP